MSLSWLLLGFSKRCLHLPAAEQPHQVWLWTRLAETHPELPGDPWPIRASHPARYREYDARRHALTCVASRCPRKTANERNPSRHRHAHTTSEATVIRADRATAPGF